MALAFIGFEYPATNPLLLALVGRSRAMDFGLSA